MRLSCQATVTECQDELLFKDYLVGDPKRRFLRIRSGARKDGQNGD